MDKFMDSPWFMRIVALVLAVLLFVSVYDSNQAKIDANAPQGEDTETISNVPVEVYYDKENLVVSGVPKTVNVIIQGPKHIVQSAKVLKDFTVYADLADAPIGNQRATLKAKGLSDKLTVKIDPATVNVSVQEKITKEFKVDVEFSRNLLAEGFEADKPIVDPRVVNITGAKDVLERITYVKATVNTNGSFNDTVTKGARVTVLDRELNKLDVSVDPEMVTVTIPVKNPSKTVPVKYRKVGAPSPDVTIQDIQIEPEEVTIYGRTETIAAIPELIVPIDVSNVKEDTVLYVPVKFPNGVNKITPEKIKVKITVEKKTQESTVQNIEISSKGLDEGLSMEFLSPSSGSVNLEVSGSTDALKNVAPTSFRVLADLSGLKAGDHIVPLKVSGPNYVSWRLADNKAKIRLTEKDAEKEKSNT